MREILFKAKRIDYNEWVEGCLVFDEFDNIYRIITQLDYSTGTHLNTNHAPRVDKDTICQYTGMRDRDGNKIWENDILECYRFSHGREKITHEVVKYINGHFKTDAIDNLSFNSSMQWVKVTGNIFCNPKLVNGDKNISNEESLMIIKAIPAKIWNQLSESENNAIAQITGILEPKQPKVQSTDEKTHYKCPECDFIFLTKYKEKGYRMGNMPKHCERCGQAIDWSKVD